MSDGITLSEFVHKIGFAVSLDGLNAYEKSLQRVDEKMEQMYGGAQKLIGRLEDMGKQLSLKLTLPITALAGVSIAARVHQEEMQKTWGVFFGNMQQGIQFTKQLRELSEKTQFEPEQINEYAKALFRLKTPVNEISPMIKRFADIAAGTGQDAGQLMSEYAQAKLNPIMRGRVIQRLMREGAISEAELKKAGIDPRLMRREAGLDRLGMGSLDKIFNELALKNMGKSAELANQLGKNFKTFWDSLTRVREAIGAMIEKVAHLNGLLKAGSEAFKWIANSIENASPMIKSITVFTGAFLAILGPGLLTISMFAKGIMGIRAALTLLSLNPLVLEVTAVIGAMALLLLVARQINIEIRKFQGKDLGTVNEGKFMAAGGKMDQFTKTGKGAVSDATFSRPVFNAASVGPSTYVPRDIFGTGSPVIVNVNNPSVTLPHGTTAEHAAIIESSHAEIIDKAIKKAVSQVHNAKR